LTIGEKDLADLAFSGLSSHLTEKMGGGGHDFTAVNQVLQRAVIHENRARDHRSHGRFKEARRDKKKQVVNLVDEESVDMPWPISCSFLKPNDGNREEMRYMFDVSKCDKLFDLLVQGGVIKLKEGHVIPAADLLAKRKYCKWNDSYRHTTNECHYF
jgi:hypothetical protein